MVDAEMPKVQIRLVVLPNGFSFFLNLSRFSAALVVFVTHALLPGAMLSLIAPFRFEHDAVIVFFVLSGYLVSFAAMNREPTLSKFIICRAARILSVSVPALVLTAGYEIIGRLLWPNWVSGSLSHLMYWLMGSLLFVNEAWYLDLRIASETPYWSLAYEVWFYALFAACFFLNGSRRIVWALIIGFLAGPKILLLMPVWLLGVAVFRLHHRGETKSPVALTVFVIFILIYVAWKCAISRDPYFDTLGWLGPRYATFIWSKTGLDVTPSSMFVHDFLIGLIFSALLWSARSLSFSILNFQFSHNMVRWGAGISFSLYLYQIPIFSIIIRMCSYKVDFSLFVPLMLVSTFTTVAVLAKFTEYKKSTVERWVQKLADVATNRLPQFSTALRS